MAVLLQLAAQPGRVITRTELLDAVWGATIVQEDALTQAVSQLRRLLDDDPRRPAFIETIPKQGYRLIAAVRTADEAGTAILSRGSAARRGSARRWLIAAALVAAVVVAAATIPRSRSPGLDAASAPAAWDERPLTTLPGEEAYPAVSPDGGLVAFSWRPEGSPAFRLQLLRRQDGAVTSLTDGPDNDTSAAWAPDGERLAFARESGDGSRVCVVAAIGGSVREPGPVHWLLGGLDWAPDGASIIYSAKDMQDAPMRLLRLHLADGRLDTLTTPEPLARGDTYPRFSPDGARLAFLRSDHGSSRDVFVMPAAGGALRKLTRGLTTCGGLDWAPDGGSLIVSATWRGPYELWRVPTDGGKATLLPARSHRPLHPACGPDAGPLVFVDSVLDTDLEILPLDHPGTPRTVAPSTRLDLGGNFSPDGATVLFISERSGARELWLLDLATGRVRQLAAIAGDALRKALWSPDGRRVAVNVARDGWLQVVVVDVASGLQRQATPAGGHHRLGHWSVDGSGLYYSRERGSQWQIARVGLDGNGAVDAAAPGCLSLHEAADGALTYFKETEPGLFRMRAGDQGEERLALLDDAASLDNLEVTDTGLWFVRAAGDSAWLSFRDFATGAIRDAALLPEAATGEFDVAPDGRSFLCSVVARSGADLAVVPTSAIAPASLTAPDRP